MDNVVVGVELVVEDDVVVVDEAELVYVDNVVVVVVVDIELVAEDDVVVVVEWLVVDDVVVVVVEAELVDMDSVDVVDIELLDTDNVVVIVDVELVAEDDWIKIWKLELKYEKQSFCESPIISVEFKLCVIGSYNWNFNASIPSPT